MDKIRSPICTVLGHVDHGKSSILDSVRDSNILSKEAGGITQAIGASIIPLNTIKTKCGDLLKALNMNFTIPGLLFIDTPGHAAFTSLRKRGGALADIAILVVDINEGPKPQTLEAIDILKTSKTPFVVAANKVDLIPGYQSDPKKAILKNIADQPQQVMTQIETKMYELVGALSEHGLESERFDRVQDYTSQIAIVPVSAKSLEGIPSLLMVIAGLAQRYLEKNLHIDDAHGAKGSILEIKEQKGIGKAMDIILYDGTLKKDDQLVIGAIDEPVVTKVKMLLEPEENSEMRDKKTKYVNCKEVVAATGVRVVATDVDSVIAGMPIRSGTAATIDKLKEEVQEEVESALIQTDKDGIVIKADTIGSLEAMANLLAEKEIPVMKSNLGGITKKDLIDAESNFENDPEFCVVLGFNVEDTSGIQNDKVKVITGDIIYKILDDLDDYLKKFKEEAEKRELEGLTFPAKVEVLEGYIFRQSNPAVFGVHVLEGKVKTGMPLMVNGKTIGEVKGIKKEKDSISIAEKGDQVAISVDGVTIGRQLDEGDTFFSAMNEEEYRRFKDLKKHLKDKEKEVLKEIASIMRKENMVWGV